MGRPYKKLSQDRVANNIAQATASITSSLVTSDISRGEVVDVEIDNDTEGTANIKQRRTGAIPINISLNTSTWVSWTIDGTRLVVALGGTRTGTVSFWVF